MVIKGKVAEILDKYTLAANIGEEDGVTEGMKFQVYEEGPLIRDPETDEVLGRPETVKTTLVAKDVKEKMSIMETTSTSFNIGDIVNPLSGMSKQNKMKTDDNVKDDRKKVEVGDDLRQIEIEEYESSN